MDEKRPLVVDLDGSLLRGDSLDESVILALKQPHALLAAVRELAARGKAALKRELATSVDLDVELLPVNTGVIETVRTAKSQGRRVYLATGADSTIAAKIADRFPEFDGIFGSDGVVNLTSRRKADLLTREFGEHGFDYIGNARGDRNVWSKAGRAVIVSRSNRPPRWARGIHFSEVIRADGPTAWRAWARELRLHQSVKNILIFLPILAAHQVTDLSSILRLMAGFLIFSVMASSVYLLNDVLDVRSDRLHPRKSARPVASGSIRPVHALTVSAILAIVAIASSFLIGPRFVITLLTYALLTTLYSFWLKRIAIVDVLVLAMLYMIRIVAGAVITDIELSFWFTGVTLFLFISLALVKRYTEIARQVTAGTNDRIPGRGYRSGDAAVVLPLGIGAGVAVLLLMTIYIQSDAVTLLYPSAMVLWFVVPGLFYWVANLWIKAGRGTMHDDPIVFALRDRASLFSAAFIAAVFLIASTPIVRFLATALPRHL